MKVSKLIELLNTENQDAEVFTYLSAEQGFKVVGIGQEGGAVIGKGISDDGRITSEDDLATWTEESSLDGTLCRNGYPIDECKCC